MGKQDGDGRISRAVDEKVLIHDETRTLLPKRPVSAEAILMAKTASVEKQPDGR